MDGTVDYNWMAIIVATVVTMIIGAIWYAPMVFGKAWMAFVGKTEKQMQKSSNTAYLYAVVFGLVQTFVLAHVVAYTTAFYPGYTNFWIGVFTGIWVWLGFVLTSLGVAYMFAGRRKKLLLIDAGYHLVALTVAGVILATWV